MYKTFSMELEVMDFTPLKLPTLSSMGVVTRSSTDSESAPGYTVYTIFIGISISGIRFVCILLRLTPPNVRTIAIATSVRYGFLTNIFVMVFNFPFLIGYKAKLL